MQDIGRLQIAVQDAALMGIVHGQATVASSLAAARGRQRAGGISWARLPPRRISC